MAGRILFIDDDRAGREVALFNLLKAGYEVTAASDGQEGLAAFSPEKFDLVVTDVKMPGISGIEVLRRIRSQAPDVPVLVITAFGNVETAVEAMKEGAYDFIGKPFHRDQLLLSVGKAFERRRLAAEVHDLRIRAGGVEREIVSVSPAMKQVLQVADRVAGTDATVLITGESGTGKEAVARRIHVRSRRAEGPFVAVNCAAIPGELLESELFGHARGAFTGAVRDRAGRFRQAAGGTLFLDEVGEIPLPLQAKLLRVLQERAVDVVGGDRPIPVDARIVAATNRDLPSLLREGTFREDLYYRLNVVEIRVPPLRERPEDIPPLVDYFTKETSADRELTVPPAVIEELKSRPWPGNVRELSNACERMAILCRGNEVSPGDLPPVASKARGAEAAGAEGSGEEWPPLPPEGLSLVDLEKKVIERALRLKGGNITQTAAYLRIPRHVLVYRIEKFGIRRDA
ncbi:MAG: Fis family transcriptional regulator [Deltaproteobacteria bacterium RBG_19FT_COMBO_60_16]|nr:MAG: Fis family transcriptional regulator [Deltaproteobacteria bacterium RBG_16_64_85]OGP99734.1 MAG: Fis family transcriptional regulator [Deltaproteobacteria bacterium RBG_19FT_COMBO_60_16]